MSEFQARLSPSLQAWISAHSSLCNELWGRNVSSLVNALVRAKVVEAPDRTESPAGRLMRFLLGPVRRTLVYCPRTVRKHGAPVRWRRDKTRKSAQTESRANALCSDAHGLIRDIDTRGRLRGKADARYRLR